MTDFKNDIAEALKKIDYTEYLNILEKNLPKYLYRYCRHDNTNIDMIINNKLKVVNPANFNDPFDSLVNELDPAVKNQKNAIELAIQKAFLSSNDKVIEVKHEILKNNLLGTKLSYNKKAEILRNIIDKIAEKSTEIEMIELNRIRYTFNKFYGFSNKFIRQPFIENAKVACFSEEKNNVLMWAHYGNYCSGFCIRYTTTDIFDDVKNGKYLLVPIIYKKFQYDGYNDPISEESLSTIWNARQFMYKSEQWQYEKEWRIVIPNYSNTYLELSKPQSIYFGTNFETINSYISDSDKIQIEMYIKLLEYAKKESVNLIRLRPRSDIAYGFDEQ